MSERGRGRRPVEGRDYTVWRTLVKFARRSQGRDPSWVGQVLERVGEGTGGIQENWEHERLVRASKRMERVRGKRSRERGKHEKQKRGFVFAAHVSDPRET